MLLLKFLQEEMETLDISLNNLLIGCLLSSFANVGMIVTAISVANVGTAGATKYFLMFIIIFLIYYYCQRYTFHTVAFIFQQALNRLRLRLSNKIRQSELASIEDIGIEQISSIEANSDCLILLENRSLSRLSACWEINATVWNVYRCQ